MLRNSEEIPRGRYLTQPFGKTVIAMECWGGCDLESGPLGGNPSSAINSMVTLGLSPRLSLLMCKMQAWTAGASGLPTTRQICQDHRNEVLKGKDEQCSMHTWCHRKTQQCLALRSSIQEQVIWNSRFPGNSAPDGRNWGKSMSSLCKKTIGGGGVLTTGFLF